MLPHWLTCGHQQAIIILKEEELPQGSYPQGSFQSSTKVSASFFSKNERDYQDSCITRSMPFLYNILMGMIPCANGQHLTSDESGPPVPSNDPSDSEIEAPGDIGLDGHIPTYEPLRHDHATSQFQRVSAIRHLHQLQHANGLFWIDCYDHLLNVRLCSKSPSQ